MTVRGPVNRPARNARQALLVVLAVPAAVLLVPAGADATITEFPLPQPQSFPGPITAGPDGALWFPEGGANPRIGRITTAGAVTEFPITNSPGGITAGPDGALW